MKRFVRRCLWLTAQVLVMLLIVEAARRQWSDLVLYGSIGLYGLLNYVEGRLSC